MTGSLPPDLSELELFSPADNTLDLFDPKNEHVLDFLTSSSPGESSSHWKMDDSQDDINKSAESLDSDIMITSSSNIGISSFSNIGISAANTNTASNNWIKSETSTEVVNCSSSSTNTLIKLEESSRIQNNTISSPHFTPSQFIKQENEEVVKLEIKPEPAAEQQQQQQQAAVIAAEQQPVMVAVKQENVVSAPTAGKWFNVIIYV